MAQPLSALPTDLAAHRRLRPVLLWAVTSLATVVLLATFALWLHYGTTVFFEMIAAGFAACF
jgi:hypothetical protein